MSRMLHKFTLWIYRLFVRSGFHYGAALILARWTKPLSPKGKHRVLCLNKAVFSDDLKAIDAASADICFLSFPRLQLSEYVRKHVKNFDELNDGSYHRLLGGTPAQKQIYEDMKKLLQYLRKRLRFDMIFAGNYVYVSQQEFVRAVHEAQIPIVVLYKEGLAPLGSMTNRVNHRLYNGKIFIGDKLLFYNESIRQALIAAKIPGISESITTTVGIPRLDQYIRKNDDQGDEKKIVLFAFDPARKAFRYVSDETKVEEYIRRGESFQADIVRFCIDHPEYQLTVKTKSTLNARESFLELIRNYGIEEVPGNTVISASIQASALIRSSRYVAGFTSTTLLEALILDRYLICPQYQGLLPLEETDFFSEYPQAANYVNDYDQLSRIILNRESLTRAQPEVKEMILKPLIYETDGRSADRVYKELRTLLPRGN